MRRALALILRTIRAILAPWARPTILEYRLEYLPVDRINPQSFRFTVPRSYNPRPSDYPF